VGRAPPDAEGAVTLFVHTHVREDAFLLYGFASREERAVFRQLIGVSSIGPKIALSILGALSVAGAVFLIVEMSQPYGGWFQISSAPLRAVLAQLGQ